MVTPAPETPPGRKPRARRRPQEQASPRTIASQRKAAEACRLREQGMAYHEIAKALGYANQGAAWKAVERAKAAIPREKVMSMVATEDARLDVVLRDAFNVRETALAGRDGDLVLKAGAQILKVSESRRKLYGMDAPAKTELSGSAPLAIVFDPALQFPPPPAP